MRRFVSQYLMIVLGLVGLTACATMAVPEARNNLVSSVENFSQRLRWKEMNGAVRYLMPGQEEGFRDLFDGRDTLHFVDVRVERMEMPAPDRATSWLLIEYYELPSVAVRRQKVELPWVLHKEGEGMLGQWKIADAFSLIETMEVKK